MATSTIRETITTVIRGTPTVFTEILYYTTTAENGAPRVISISTVDGIPSGGLNAPAASSSSSGAGGVPGPENSLGSTSTEASTNTAANTSRSTSASPAGQTDGLGKESGQKPDGLSTGAKAGIGIGVALSVALVLAAVLVLYIRRRRKKTQQEGSSGGVLGEKRTPGRGNSARSQVLPTWKGELSADSVRAELDGTEKNIIELDSDRHQAELYNETKPTEMDGSTPDAVQASGISELAHSHDDSRTVQELEQAVDPAMPPPIPYASKPRPR